MSSAQKMYFLLNVFQMTATGLMTHLNSSNDVVNHPDAHFLGCGTNLLSDGHFEFIHGLWIVLIRVVHQNHKEIKI